MYFLYKITIINEKNLFKQSNQYFRNLSMTFYVYLIVSKISNKYISYVGYTNNLHKRIKKHNLGTGAKFTKGKKWTLIYYECYDTKKKAMRAEHSLKKNYNFRKKIKNENGFY